MNYEVLNANNPDKALQVALKKGLEIEESVKKMVHGLPKEKHHLIKICRWEDARKSPYHQDKIKIFLNEFEGKIYDLHPYPGLSCLDDLLMNLQNGKLFPKLAKMLDIKNKIAEVEAYVE